LTAATTRGRRRTLSSWRTISGSIQSVPGPLRQARLLEPYALLWITLAYEQKLGRTFACRLMRR
jgi:hypothetical protein